MGVVKFYKDEYNTIEEDSDNNCKDDMIQYEKILQQILTKMYLSILKSKNLPSQNQEGCIETIVMRSVHGAMSKVRHEMKHNYKTED